MNMKSEFLGLLKDARLGLNSKETELDYQTLYQLSSLHQVSGLIYNQIYQFSNFPIEIKNIWKQEAIKSNVSQTIKSDRILQVYQQFLDADLKVLVVKGMILRSLYPIPENRPSNDEDLYVEMKDFEAVKKIFLDNRFLIVSQSEDVTTFADPISHASVELHVNLFSKESKAYGNYQNSFEHAFDDPLVHQIQNVFVYSLNCDLHFLFLVMHFVKHFLHGGIGMRQVVDIIMYAEKYGDQINWEKIYETLEELHVLKLIENVFQMAIDHLAFDTSKICLPQDFNIEKWNYEALLDDILDAGVFGQSSMERVHSSTMTLNAVHSGKTSVLKSVFPSYTEMKNKYEYLKQFPFLLPYAWLCRIFHYVSDKKQGNHQKTIEMGNQRIALLKQYQVIDK